MVTERLSAYDSAAKSYYSLVISPENYDSVITVSCDSDTELSNFNIDLYEYSQTKPHTFTVDFYKTHLNEFIYGSAYAEGCSYSIN